MSGGVDFAAVKAVQLSAVVGQSVQLRRAGGEFVGCCPFHADRTPSFTVNDDKGFYHCFGCGAHGDAADFIAAATSCSIGEAARQLGAGNLPTIIPRPQSDASEAKSETADLARRLWRGAEPIRGTAAERYLTGRGLTLALPATLRSGCLKHPRGGVHPCLVAITITPEGGFAGIQCTFLTDDGQKASLSPVKLSLGRVAGCAIRLAPPAAELIVCEGMEDGLSVQQELGRAVWASAGASMLAAMGFPPIVQSVVIAADNDAAGERAAIKAAQAFAGRGLRVHIMRPASAFKDFNEQLTSLEAKKEAA